MSIVHLPSTIESLKPWMEKLKNHPVVVGNPDLEPIMYNFTGFFDVLCVEIEKAIQDYREIAKELYKYHRNPNGIVSATDFSYIDKYRQIQEAGGDADLIARICRMDDVSEIMQLKVLNHLFHQHLSLDEIKKIIARNNT